jgi:polysaccharide export outer membrane protein
MTAVVSNPGENIYVWPGDVITLLQAPEKFSVFGAISTNTQVPFGADRLDLTQAIAKAGGLLDARADPDGVFLFRFERPEVVKALGIPSLADGPGRGSPVVYHLNLRQVNGYFLAQRFPIQDNDLIYVANAQMAELQKFFTLVGSITGPVIGGTVVVRGVSH